MALNPKDWRAWHSYQNGFASNYTKEFIDKLDCSDEMKARITADVRAYNAGGELPTSQSGELTVYDVGYNGTDWRWL